MNNARNVCLILLLLVSSSLFLIMPSSAQSIPKPSVPEFTLRYARHPYDVSPTYGVDQYTGQQVIISPGYHYENRSVEIVIKNQPFTPIMLDATHQANLYYNISYRGHYGTDWSYFLPFNDTLGWFMPQQSTSEYTVIAFKELPDDAASFDFRVQAQIGYFDEYHMPFTVYSFTGQVSGWSGTQVIDVPPISQSSPNPTQQATPTSTAMSSPTATANTPNGTDDSQENLVLYGVIAGLAAAVAVLAVVVARLNSKVKAFERKPAI